MRFARSALAIGLSLGSVARAASGADLLVTPNWLKTQLGDPKLVLLHVGARADFEKEHIAGAQHVLPADLSIPRAEGSLILQILPPDALRAKLETYGISDDSRVVVYFGTDAISPTTRVYWSLDMAGLGAQTSVLDGGLPAWKAVGGAVTAVVTPNAPGKLKPHEATDIAATLDLVKSASGPAAPKIIDARLPEFYRGENPGLGARAGRIPGAANIPFTSLADEKLHMKSEADVRAMFAAAGIGPGDSIISYCHIGQQATMIYFNAKRLGLSAKVYDGSWDEWSRSDQGIESSALKTKEQ
jgi:thiosulfate/3-mercaptopyruvate sulfurtransferase